jgi:hypothetical protein
VCRSCEKKNRIALAMIDQLPQSSLQSAGLAQSGRPKSFPELEEQLRTGIDFNSALNMFLHEFYRHRDPRFFAGPPSQQLSDINRAALAGTAEYLCHRFGYDAPAWTDEPDYFLESERNWFEDAFDQDYLVEHRKYYLGRSAQEFTRRNLVFPVLVGPLTKAVTDHKNIEPVLLSVGQYVSWWTGRGSKGQGRITKTEGDRIFVQPSEDSIKGSDYRVHDSGSVFWTPINTGIPMDQINTEPDPWYEDS